MPQLDSDVLTLQDFKKTYTLDTRWMDNDIYGHVNNVTYYSYFDSAINRFLIEEGSLDIHKGQSIGFIVKSECEFLKAVAYPDSLICGIAVTKLGNSSVSYLVGLFKAGEERACAIGHMTHVFVDRQTTRPVAISGKLRVALESIVV